MTTLNELRQRLELEYLEPVEEETPQVPATSAINDSQQNFTLTSGILSPDEESYIAEGSVIEWDDELMRVTSYDELTKQIVVERGVRGSLPAAHTVDSWVRIPTRWPRISQIQALRSAIEALWQPLFVYKEERAIVDISGYIALPLNTVRLVDVVYQSGHSRRWRSVPAQLFSTHPEDPDRASIQVGLGPPANALCVVRYGVRVEAPTLSTDTIEDLPEKWERIVIVDAAANLLAGVDVDAQSQESLTEKIRLENFPVRSGSQISQALIRYREYLVSLAERELVARHPRRIVNRTASAWRQ